MEFTPDHCSYWSGIPQDKQTEFTRRAIDILCRALGAPYNIAVNWDKVDWRYGTGVSFVLGRSPSLATWDFNHLTKLVIGAHDECVRVEVEPHGFGYLRISMWPRAGRDGDIARRHPTIEQAIAQYRGTPPPAEDAYDRGRRDMLNAILALNPAAAASLAKVEERTPDPYGRLPFDVVFWVTTVADQLGIKTLDEMQEAEGHE